VRRLLFALVAMGLLLVVADRVGASVAERAVASDLQASGLGGDPVVDIHGVPFLTQALRGRYEQIVVTARDVPAGEVRFAEFEATLIGAQVSVSQALRAGAGAVPVDALRARALVPYDELGRRSEATDVRVEPAAEPDRVRVTGSVEVLSRTLSVATVSRVELDRGEVLVTAESVDVGNDAVSGALSRALEGKLDLRLPIEDLPYGLVPSGLEVTPRGIRVDAFATQTVITPR
jgi:hypothetical protein